MQKLQTRWETRHCFQPSASNPPWAVRCCFSDHKFSCVETVKYKFDSGTWYVDVSLSPRCLCFCSSIPVGPQCCLQSDNSPHPLQTHPDLSAGAVGTDYSNKETTSVSLKPSNFAIKRLPDYLVAEHQIPLHSDGQKPVTSTNPWHLITEVCFCAKLLLCGGGALCLHPTDFCLSLTQDMLLAEFVFFPLKATVICLQTICSSYSTFILVLSVFFNISFSFLSQQ